MRDQLNGQLYDGWRTDCDDAYEHQIIPADEREPYSGYNCNKIPTVARIDESLQQGTPCRKNVADDVGMFCVDQNGYVGRHLVSPVLRESGDIARYNSLGGTADAHAWCRPYARRGEKG